MLVEYVSAMFMLNTNHRSYKMLVLCIFLMDYLFYAI